MPPAEGKGGGRKSGAARSGRASKKQGEGKKGSAKDGAAPSVSFHESEYLSHLDGNVVPTDIIGKLSRLRFIVKCRG